MKQEEINKIEQELKEQKIKHNIITVFLDEDDESKTATFFLRKPDRTVRKLIGSLASKDGLEAVYAALKNLYIKGDSIEAIRSNDYALASAENSVVDMLKVQESSIKKN